MVYPLSPFSLLSLLGATAVRHGYGQRNTAECLYHYAFTVQQFVISKPRHMREITTTLPAFEAR